MKKVLILVTWLMSVGCVSAFEVTFEQGPVDVVVGASYGNKYSPLFDDALNESYYLDYAAGLTREGFIIQNEAQGAATSYDQPEVGLRGIHAQVDRALNVSPLWPDRVRSVTFTLLNDCIHSIQCSDADMDALMETIYSAAEKVRAAGKCVNVNAYPETASLNLKEAMAFYFGPGVYTISDLDLEKLRAKQKAKFENVPWINFVYPWEKAGEFPDGLHPGTGQMKKGAHIGGKAINDCPI